MTRIDQVKLAAELATNDSKPRKATAACTESIQNVLSSVNSTFYLLVDDQVVFSCFKYSACNMNSNQKQNKWCNWCGIKYSHTWKIMFRYVGQLPSSLSDISSNIYSWMLQRPMNKWNITLSKITDFSGKHLGWCQLGCLSTTESGNVTYSTWNIKHIFLLLRCRASQSAREIRPIEAWNRLAAQENDTICRDGSKHFKSFEFFTLEPSASSDKPQRWMNLQGRSRDSLVSYYITFSQSVRVHATIDSHSLLLGLLADAGEQGSLCHSASERQCSLCAEQPDQMKWWAREKSAGPRGKPTNKSLQLATTLLTRQILYEIKTTTFLSACYSACGPHMSSNCTFTFRCFCVRRCLFCGEAPSVWFELTDDKLKEKTWKMQIPS